MEVNVDEESLLLALKDYPTEFIQPAKFFNEKLPLLSQISPVVLTQDNIIVWGRNLVEHNEHLSNVFLKIRKRGLKLNKKKCQIGVKSIVFLGHMISSEDVKVDPSKFGAITKMPLPNSVNELQRFLDFITYLGKFIPNLPEVTSPLHILLKKEVEFKLEKAQLDAIGKLKLLVTTTLCLIPIYKLV